MTNLKRKPCEACGKQIQYITKKPKLCTSCHLSKPKGTPTKRKRPPSQNTKAEKSVFSILDDLLSGYPYINHGYYSNLQSPKGYPMQLDRYYPSLQLAFEIDGAQHDTYIKYLSGSKKNFAYTQQCDRAKNRQCKEQGICLIRIKHTEKPSDALLLEKIKQEDQALWARITKE